MKQERDVLVIGCSCRLMGSASPAMLVAGVSSSPEAAATTCLTHQPFPTPSPFTFSVTSTRWSSRPSINFSNLFLRFLALLFSFVSALSLSLGGSGSKKNDGQQQTSPSSFAGHPEFMYCFIVNISAFVYSSFQLFKGICDIAHRGILISDLISDYISFILDQLVGYLLISSSSVAIPVIQQTAFIWRAAILSTTMSFLTFLIFAACALLSGYKLCKRIIW